MSFYRLLTMKEDVIKGAKASNAHLNNLPYFIGEFQSDDIEDTRTIRRTYFIEPKLQQDGTRVQNPALLAKFRAFVSTPATFPPIVIEHIRVETEPYQLHKIGSDTEWITNDIDNPASGTKTYTSMNVPIRYIQSIDGTWRAQDDAKEVADRIIRTRGIYVSKATAKVDDVAIDADTEVIKEPLTAEEELAQLKAKMASQK